MYCSGFSPIANIDAETLILGSIPSIKSLEKQQYYGHPQNSFWWIMGEIFTFDSTIEYQLRIEKMLEHKIAIWDVLQQCERKGSLDSAIIAKTIKPNDFKTFFLKYKNIKKVIFNGTKAEKEFNKHVKLSNNSIILHKAPSTSPAMAILTKNAKLAIWKKLIT